MFCTLSPENVDICSRKILPNLKIYVRFYFWYLLFRFRKFLKCETFQYHIIKAVASVLCYCMPLNNPPLLFWQNLWCFFIKARMGTKNFWKFQKNTWRSSYRKTILNSHVFRVVDPGTSGKRTEISWSKFSRNKSY